MQVRYQAAPRPDENFFLPIPRVRPERLTRAANHTLTPQNLHELLELDPHLADDLLALGGVRASFLATELVAGTADREALVVQEAADLADHNHILALVIAPVAASLDRLQLRELLFPIAQHMRLHTAQIAHLSNGEIALAGDRRQLGVILWLQHTLRPAPSVSVQDGTSPRAAR